MIIFNNTSADFVLISQLPAVKNDTISGAAETNFWPFLFCDYFSSSRRLTGAVVTRSLHDGLDTQVNPGKFGSRFN